MKRKLFITLITSTVVILSVLVLTGCCEEPFFVDQTQSSLQTSIQTQDTQQENRQQNTSANSTVQQVGVHQISSQNAREIAAEFVGYGVVHDIQAFTDEDTLIFEVDIRHDAMRYVVLLNAESGNVTSLMRYEVGPIDTVDSPDADTVTDTSTATSTITAPNSTITTSNPATAQNESLPQTTNETTRLAAPTPAPPPTSGRGTRPSNPAISLDRAIEIAYADLASRGIDATYRSHSGMDWERGQWVWELLFRTHGERMPLIEYYINADNGNIVKFEWDD